jgi:hypothetical protein
MNEFYNARSSLEAGERLGAQTKCETLYRKPCQLLSWMIGNCQYLAIFLLIRRAISNAST